MNQTAKKLRDIAQNAVVTPGSGKPYSVIATIKSAFGFDSILAPEVLLQFIAAIADELDELQARATEANNLRKKLESAEDKAERRKQYIGYLETALHDKNSLLEQRGGTIARLTAECSELRKQVPSERERQILNMWPRFEDGEPVMPGDKVHYSSAYNDETEIEVESITAMDGCFVLCDDECRSNQYEQGQRVKRPVQSVLDADGVEIKAGDTVWHEDGSEQLVEEMNRYGVRCFDGDKRRTFDPKYLTHTRPDSWERLEDDASKDTCVYFGGTGHFDCSECSSGGVNCFRRMKLDIVRRAKALAGVEVGR